MPIASFFSPLTYKFLKRWGDHTFSIEEISKRLHRLFLIPALILLLISLLVILDQYSRFLMSERLQNRIIMIDRDLSLVNALQKERGRSIVALDHPRDQGPFFQAVQRSRNDTDKIYRSLRMLPVPLQSAEGDYQSIRRLIDKERETLKNLRHNYDEGKINFNELMNSYSTIIDNFLLHLLPDPSSFQNRKIRQLLAILREDLELSEYLGRERAILGYLLTHPEFLHNRQLNNLLLRYDALIRHERKLLFHLIRQENRLPKGWLVQEREKIDHFQNLKKKILTSAGEKVSLSTWWNCATEAIEHHYLLEKWLLNQLYLTRKAQHHRSLFILLSALTIILLLGVLHLLILRYMRWLTWKMRKIFEENRQTRLAHETLSSFLETLIYNDQLSTQKILLSTCTILEESSFFRYLSILEKDQKGYRAICSRGFPVTEFNRELAYSIQKNDLLAKGLSAVQRKKKMRILRAPRSYPRPFFHEIRHFGLFPVSIRGESRYVIFAAGTHARPLHSDTILLLKKLSRALGYAFEKIEAEQAEELFRQELRISAQTFQSHEAITITDASGKIIKINDAFMRITGYSQEEVVGKTPNILKSGIHDETFYKEMWKRIHKEGHWSGEIYNKRKDGVVYPELLSISAVKSQEGEITHYVAHFYDISEMKAAQKEAEHRATHDPLTDLYNRHKLIEELERIHRQTQIRSLYGAFFFFDLDDFKQINDYHGHGAGDKILRQTARRLKKSMFPGAIPGRISGDEFALIVPFETSSAEEAQNLAEKQAKAILEIMEKPVKYRGKNIQIGLSMGIRIFPLPDRTRSDIVPDADIAMYHAKQSGKGEYRLFTKEMALESHRFLQLQNEIKEGIKTEQFILYYQPKIQISTKKIVGMEALVRWRHPVRGLLTPDAFLDVVHESQLGSKLHALIQKQLFRQLKIWTQRYENFDLRASLNVSTEEFNRPAFSRKFEESLKSSGIDPQLLDLEIVEDGLLRNIDYAIDVIRHFQAMGITFSMDDFGTGYSSLNYLNKLPVDVLKIDRSFLLEFFESRNQEVVKMIIHTAKVFQMECVAEGVETISLLKDLEAYGCNYAQGYLFDPPLPPEEFERKWLKEKKRRLKSAVQAQPA